MPSFSFRGCTSVCVGLLALLCAPPRIACAQPAGDVKALATEALHVRDLSLAQLNVDPTFGRAMSLTIPLGGIAHTLELAPNSIRAKDYRLLEQGADGQILEAKAGPENTLIGRLADVPGSEVEGGMMPEGVYATIAMPDGDQWWIEPLDGRVAGAAAGTYAVYRAGDVIVGPWACGNVNERSTPVAPASFSPRDTNLYTAVLACDADFEYYSQYGSVALVQARISLIVNTMNLQYRRDVNIRHTLGTILVRTSTSQPYTATDSAALVTQVRNEWNANQGSISRNCVQMFTNKRIVDNGNPPNIITIGRAFNIGHICDDQSYCFVWSNFNNNFASATDLSAHELGHLWNACHCSCDGGTAATRFTMNPLITSINKFGPGGAASECGNVNITEITGYRTGRWLPFPFGAGCLGLTSEGETVANDACANAIALEPNATVAMSNVFATTDGSASCRLTDSSNDVWYSYVAPCDGTFSLNTCGSGFDTVLSAYSGSCGSTTELTCDDDSAPTCGANSLQSAISFPVTRGSFYLIRLAGYLGATGTGFLTTSQATCPAPGNDACGNSVQVLNGFPVGFSTIGATTDGPIEALCNNVSNSQVSQDVWFRFVAACTGTVRASLCGSNFDTKIAIYAGGCPTGPNTAIACDDDNGPACAGLTSSVDFASVAGTTYMIRVGGYSTNVGSGTLLVSSLSCPRPANDDCANATPVSNGQTLVNDFLGATNDGSASCGLSTLSRDVWFDFTAPATGTLTASTCGTHDTGGQDTGVDTVLSIHSGCAGTTANEIICDDDNSGQCGSQDAGAHRDSIVTASLTAGQTVKIRVANYNNNTPPNKQITLNIAFVAANDLCATATPVGEGSFAWYNTGAATDGPATIGGGCPSVPFNADVWFSYVPSCSGTSRISLCGTTFDTVLAVYSGSCGALGAPIACDDDDGPACLTVQSSLDVTVTAGQTYLVRVGSYYPTVTGSGSLTINCAATLGACCAGSTCSLQTAAGCASPGSHFAGPSTTCNAPGVNTTPCCKADFNASGVVTVQDIFDFLSAWFAGDPRSNFNGANGITVQDIFDFLAAWFAGCP
jgi:hypothetical protein